METVTLGMTDMKVSRIAFGTWELGGEWGSFDENAAIATIRHARELGINFFDTAQGYGFGASEAAPRPGAARRSRPRAATEVVIATKGGLRMTENGLVRDSSPAWLQQGVEDSLRALGVDYIDLYQVHWPDPNVPLAETAGALDELVGEGKIRHVGVSNFDVAEMAEFAQTRPVETLQPPYSLFRREIEADLLPYTRTHDIGVLVYGPLAHGLLTGSMDDARRSRPMTGAARTRRSTASRSATISRRCATYNGLRPKSSAVRPRNSPSRGRSRTRRCRSPSSVPNTPSTSTKPSPPANCDSPTTHSLRSTASWPARRVHRAIARPDADSLSNREQSMPTTMPHPSRFLDEAPGRRRAAFATRRRTAAAVSPRADARHGPGRRVQLPAARSCLRREHDRKRGVLGIRDRGSEGLLDSCITRRAGCVRARGAHCWQGRLPAGQHRGDLLTVTTSLQALLLSASIVLAAASGEPVTSGYRYALIVLLGITMGAQNATARSSRSLT